MNVLNISEEVHYRKIWLSEYLKHINDEKAAIESLDYWLSDAAYDNLTITDDLLTQEAKDSALSKIESDRIYVICKEHASKFFHSAAITRFIMGSSVKTEGFRAAQVTSMLCNIVEQAQSDVQKERVLKTIKSDKQEDIDLINGLLTKQLEAATQLLDSLL